MMPDYFYNINLAFELENIFRLILAVILGFAIGYERKRRYKEAGIRTHTIVCLGSALIMLVSIYGFDGASDAGRVAAQIVSGVGFLGAGIIVYRKHETKGLTTAAGLWASACMGLCIGAGFYEAAIACCLLILFTVIIFSRLERVILSRSRNINIFVEFEEINDISAIVESIKSCEVRIFDVEITKAKNSDTHYPNAVFSLRLPKKITHAALMAVIAQLDTVRSIEEL